MSIAIDHRFLARVCPLEDLTPGLGVAALVDGEQVAVFRVGPDEVYAVQNYCPFSDVFVMSRGITGTRADEPTIASPIYKQVFSLVDGRCLATMDLDPVGPAGANLRVIPVHVVDGIVFLERDRAAQAPAVRAA